MIFLKSAKGNEKRNDNHSHEYASGALILILGAGRYQDAFRCRDLRNNKDFPACCITSSTWPRSANKSPKVRQKKVHQENNSNSADADPDDSTYISI